MPTKFRDVVEARVAATETSDATLLAELSNHPFVYVKLAVAHNPAASPSVLDSLIPDTFFGGWISCNRSGSTASGQQRTALYRCAAPGLATLRGGSKPETPRPVASLRVLFGHSSSSYACRGSHHSLAC